MSNIQKEFARWQSFQDCQAEMMTKYGHNEEDAGAICSSIEHRAQKGMLYKADLENLDVIKSKSGKLIVYGPASWEVADQERPVPDYMTIEAQQDFLTKLFQMPEEYRNVSIDHESLIIGKAVKKAVGDDGKTYFSHVHEKGTMLAVEIREDTNLGWVQKYRSEIESGIYKMFSIRGSNAKRVLDTVDGTKVNKILTLDPIEVAIVKRGMCQKAGPLEVVCKKQDDTAVKVLPIEERIQNVLSGVEIEPSVQPVKAEVEAVKLDAQRIFNKYFKEE